MNGVRDVERDGLTNPAIGIEVMALRDQRVAQIGFASVILDGERQRNSKSVTRKSEAKHLA